MNWKLYFSLFFFICLSKEVLVFNEEFLIVLSFFLFIFLFYSLSSNQICLDLDLRASTIKEEFNFYIKIQKDLYSYLNMYYLKQKSLPRDISKIYFFLKKDILLVIESYPVLVLKLLFWSLDDKLKKVFSFELKLQALIRTKIVFRLYDYLFLTFSKRKKTLRSIFVKRALTSLSKLR